MPFDLQTNPPGKLRVAVIGAGISGLGAAYTLASDHEVTLYEAEPRLGGHARTITVGRECQVDVDTGFIVFNYRNYPLLSGLFAELDVPVQKSDMAFSASLDDGRFEYGLHATSALFAQRRNLFRPLYWRMLLEIPRFNRSIKRYADQLTLTLGEALSDLGMSDWFRRYFILPLAGAIWSGTPEQMLAFPAAAFVRFFDNHGLLTLHDQPQWYTVNGGSKVYVAKVEDVLLRHGTAIRTGTPVQAVGRDGGAWVKPQGGEAEAYDAVVFACHSDQALTLLADPSPEERMILGNIRYTPNRVIVHDDPSLMPQRRACWAAWNYRGRTGGRAEALTVTYWMNRLQSLPAEQPLFVTLNPEDDIPARHMFDETVLHHPVFDLAAMQAQQALAALQGQRNTWYCGAYTRYGFHEDGLASGVAAAKALGAEPQWA
jgi:uncharacterized protein